jgi:uncharacterized membrane protein HdeD (DUF308 family)
MRRRALRLPSAAMVLIAATPEEARASRALLYALLVYGLLMLGLGVFLIASPHETLKVITVILGICLIVDGVIAVAGAVAGRVESRGLLALVGIISVVAGLVLVEQPFAALTLFVVIIGIWFVVAGLARFVAAFTSREGRGTLIIGAIIDVIAGVVILSWRDITLATLAVVIGIVLVVRGIAFAWAAWQLLRLERGAREDQSGAPLTA